MEKVTRIKIGDVVIAASGVDSCPSLYLNPAHRLFMIRDGKPDVALEVHYGELPELDLREKVFESEGPWSLYRGDGHFILAFASPLMRQPFYRLAVMDRDFALGRIYLGASENYYTSDSSDANKAVDPFQHPFDQVLMINFLARRCLGLIIHAFGLSDAGRGLAFCGVSGAGKSTLARLWEKTQATLLSDDRLILRPQDGQVWMFGTPWHGDAQIASPQGAPLERLYFLSHSTRNHLAPLSQSQAAARLLVRCFPPFYDSQGMVNTLELINRIVTRIPCYELGFVPDESIVDFIRGHHETG